MRLHPSFVLPVFARETPIGYTSRICLRLGYNLRRFCASIGVTYQGLVDGDPTAIEKLTHVCGLPEEVFADGTIMKLPGKRHGIRGEILTMDQVNRETLRVCPCCIEEQIGPGNVVSNAHMDVRWQILPLHVCLVHRIPISAIALEKGRLVRSAHNSAWRLRTELGQGALRDLDRTVTAPSSLCTYTNDRIFGEPTAHWLSCMPLYASIKIAQIAGAEVLKVKQRRWGGMSAVLLHEVGGVGFDMLREGEDGLREVLTVAQKEYLAKNSFTGSQSMFGRLYSFLAHDCGDPAYEPARDVLRKHIIEEMPVGPGDTVLGKPVKTRLMHSVRSVTPELGLNAVTARQRLIRVGILDSSTDHLPPDQRTFEVKKHAELLGRLKTAQLRGEAIRYLGIPRIYPGIDAVLDLVGSLNLEKRPVTQQLYAKADLDRFLIGLLGKATANADGTGFEDIGLAAATAKSNIAAIVQMIWDGRIPEVGISPDHAGVMSLMVRPADVRANIVAKSTWVSLAEATNHLRVSQQTLRELVRHQLIRLRTTPQNGVELSELNAFLKAYITLSEILRVYQKLREKHNSRWTPIKALKDAGVVPIHGRLEYPVYRREEVTAALGPPFEPAY